MKHFGIVAYPASHSKSPQMHQAAFDHLSIDATFDRHEIKPQQLPQFITQRVRSEPRIEGLAVSLPHKQSIIPLLDKIDESAQKIGAVNTVFWDDQKLCGTNTDWIGCSRSLAEQYDVTDTKVLVLGAGGAARSVVYALIRDGADQIIIANRTDQTAQHMAHDFGVQWKSLSDLHPEEYHLVINTTPLGMKGTHPSLSPLPSEFWRAHLTAYDIVYTPLQTQFLLDAHNAGAKTISGQKMFVYQGMAQFELWTGKQAPQSVMQNAAKTIY